ncbi:Magnesium_transporter NIPA [Hexamita inflata]|uniref:Magnesium transporter NIPA n=1 Tax=Hexamita inflata TaxID=28002 RepID=A0AA86NIA6_9EUKA|nr:Magnesium transporter NIPA [Hexamita inflata]CAI9920715.1 Magnesium transporter NIPA [Hexamita inflata]
MITINLRTFKISELFYVGIVIELFATVIQNVGMNLQKLAHHRQQMRIDRVSQSFQTTLRTPNYCQNFQWWVALFIFIVGIVLDFVALAFIPSTVSLPVGSIGLCVSVICAHFWLHEKFSVFDLIGTVLSVGGAWCVIGFSNKTMELMTVQKLSLMFGSVKSSAVWFFCGLIVAWIISVVVSYKWKSAVSYALIPGMCGVFTVLLGGVVGQLTLNTFKGNMQMDTYQYWLCIIGLVVALLILNNYLQRALGAYDNTIVTPIYFCVILIISVLSGILFFKYFTNITTVQGCMFGLGIVLIIIGCVFLSINHIHQNQLNFTGHLNQKDEFQNIDTIQDINIVEELNKGK